MNKNLKLIIASLLFFIIIITHWLLDLFNHWALVFDSCTGNGIFPNICNLYTAGHITWYIQIGLTLALFIWLLIEIKSE